MKPQLMSRIGRGSYFFPRGGSAQGIRSTVPILSEFGWHTELASGSRPGTSHADAHVFYGDIVTATLQFGSDRHTNRYQPAPHRTTLVQLDERDSFTYERSTTDNDRWLGVMTRSDLTTLDRCLMAAIERGLWQTVCLLHLHHLTPLHGAAIESLPGIPLITHLHGTELKFLSRLIAATHPSPDQEYLIRRLRSWGQAAEATIVASSFIRDQATSLLGIPPARIVVIPNGVDTSLFQHQSPTILDSVDSWVEWLVKDPKGWDPSRPSGSLSYQETDVRRDFNRDQYAGPIMFVGRFLGFKRLDLLIHAYSRLRREGKLNIPLVIWGGSPGEWEGDHPVDIVDRLRVPGVYFVGWRGHHDLARALQSASLMVGPSTHEPFGLVYLEAMSAGVPVIASRSGGPPDFLVEHGDTANGWLFEPDDLASLMAAIHESTADPVESRRRGSNGAKLVRQRYTWRAHAERVAALYEDVRAPPRRH